MEITVKITKVLERQSFVSHKNGNTYVSVVFVGETTSSQYPKKIAFKVMGEDKINQMAIVVGATYNVSFDVESREWQGKWFTECQAWRAVRMDGQQQAAAPAPSANTQSALAPTSAPTASPIPDTTENVSSANDLPF